MSEIDKKIAVIRHDIENVLVSISDIAESYGRWKPDLRVDPRLRERLVKAVELMRADPDFGPGFMLPVSSCYRQFLYFIKGHWWRDARDPRGHYTGLAIDIGYRNVLPERLWFKFEGYMRQVGLHPMHLIAHGEWWHFSRYGKYIPNGLSKWRPAEAVQKLRGQVCRALGIL